MAEHPMDSKSQFYALEVMCRERAAVAQKEMEYWQDEADEWARFRKSCDRPGAPPISSSDHSADLKT
jgi:hypothetical protein